MATTHFSKWSLVDGDIKVSLDLSRFNQSIPKAQYKLDGDVMNSMVAFMPHMNGNFINVTKAASAAVQGTGKVYAAYGPQGRYLYEGKVMVDSETGKGPMKIEVSPGEYILRYRKGARLQATGKSLSYTRTHNPRVQSHWFDAAKKKDLNKWIKDVKNTILK